MDDGEFPRPAPEPTKKQPQFPTWELIDLVDSNIPDPESFLLPDVMSRGTITLIAGVRGVGKTYTGLWLGSSVALCGGFGPLQTKQGHVLYLSQEMGQTQIKKRISRLFSREVLETLRGRMHIKCKLPWTIDTDGGLKELEKELRGEVDSVPYDLVIVDSLRDVKGKCRESDNDEMGQAFVRFRDRICEMYNVAGVILHHKGKPGQDNQDRGSRGASSMEDVAADVIYIDRPVKNSPSRTWTFNKTRDGAMEGKTMEVSIDGDEEGTDTVHVSVTESVAETEINFELKKLYSTLELNGSSVFSLEEISQLMSWAERTSRGYVKLAKDAGRLVNTTKPPSKALYRYVALAE